MSDYTSVSLFCGAGGESAGKVDAFRSLGLIHAVSHAIDHWDQAVQVHRRNFPNINVHQADISTVTASDFGIKHIDLLWASPPCVHHSRARGGKPRDGQSRNHANEIVERWLKVAEVNVLLLKKAAVKMIGNACPVRTVAALIRAVVGSRMWTDTGWQHEEAHNVED